MRDFVKSALLSWLKGLRTLRRLYVIFYYLKRPVGVCLRCLGFVRTLRQLGSCTLARSDTLVVNTPLRVATLIVLFTMKRVALYYTFCREAGVKIFLRFFASTPSCVAPVGVAYKKS